MFKHNDRFTLTGINAIDKDGQIIDYHLSFPIDKSTFTIPENIREISVYEYHEGTEKYGYIAFKILVGKITSVRELCSPEIEDFQIDYRAFREIKEADDKLCYYEDDGGLYRVFAKIKIGDIVVNNIEELKEVLLSISDNYLNIIISVSNIKKRIKDYKSK